MKRRQILRMLTRTEANAALCGVPLTEWLAMSRADRKRRVKAAKEARRG